MENDHLERALTALTQKAKENMLLLKISLQTLLFQIIHLVDVYDIYVFLKRNYYLFSFRALKITYLSNFNIFRFSPSKILDFSLTLN